MQGGLDVHGIPGLILRVVLLPLLVGVAEGVEPEAEGIVIAALALGLASAVAAVGLLGLGILDGVVGGVDLIHFPGAFLVAGVQIRMILLGQLPVCGFDLVL